MAIERKARSYERRHHVIDGHTFGLIELLGSAAVVFGFCFWQLYQLRKLRKERERKRNADQSK